MSHLGERLSALIDGELGHAQRDRVLAHLAQCEPCRQEAAALRMLKQRMHALGEATAAQSLNDRLLALAALAGPAGRARPWWQASGWRRLGSRSRWVLRSLTLAGLMLLGAGVPAAAFLAGGAPSQQPGPSVTPPVDLFATQHAIITGQVPARPATGGQVPATAAGQPAQAVHPVAAPTAAPPTAAAVPTAAAPPTAAATAAARRLAARPWSSLPVAYRPLILSPAAAGAGHR